jgi:ribosomal protein S11
LLKKRNPDKKKYYLFIKKVKNNIFLTVTNKFGCVIVSQSAGSCKITTKKKKRSPETLKAVAVSTAKVVRSKNIRYIFKFFNTTVNLKPIRSVVESFSRVGLFVLKYIPLIRRPHGLNMRKRKVRRL